MVFWSHHVGGLGKQNSACHCKVSFFVFSGLMGTHTDHIGGPILTIFSYMSYDVFPRKDMLFGGSVDIAPHIWGQISPKLKFWGHEQAILKQMCKIFKLSYYQNYWMDSNQILHTSKDHQICFVGGPETWKTNSRWRTATILKNKKSRYLCNRFTDFDGIWHDDAPQTSRHCELLRFPEFKNPRWPPASILMGALNVPLFSHLSENFVGLVAVFLVASGPLEVVVPSHWTACIAGPLAHIVL